MWQVDHTPVRWRCTVGAHAQGLGELRKLKDPTTGEPNPQRGQGAIALVCNRAPGASGRALRAKEPAAFPTPEAAMAEIRQHVIPGAFLLPNGIFAVSVAQDAGCHSYVRHRLARQCALSCRAHTTLPKCCGPQARI